MSFSPLIQQLITALRCLPGVGPKSAQRMAFHLLERDSEGALSLSDILAKAVSDIGRCKQCRTLSEQELCDICQSESRDKSTLCVIESPVDVLAVEQTGGYNGVYFVLSGHLSPIDGVGPEDLGIDQLLELVQNTEVKEIILATNPTVEGEATAHFIAAQLKDQDIKVSRIAHGVPVGGELEFVDGGTLAHAMAGRRSLL
ncbi:MULTISPECIES: recombination mediator RecR [unclassified Neptuniibacter]|uniref:recombination mediator RecR n=1 Tax=unclassified Neptuniibacter TaxID=2630693 RepID=UPI000C55221E|nr:MULTISPECIES: recombination mediator RecR [unclassified Neptuniibacter]MAY42279.1 recombination protein RecR [Oceanospirillaceae bacterium]|tara:strand:+ start:14435 stop:15034 length:600 start_codon:yes stop_codon:yes gene_type:complete